MQHIDRGEAGRDARGEWRPEGNVKLPPIYDWPLNPRRILRWLFVYDGYLLPWNVFYVALVTALWFWLSPALADMATLEPGWIAQVYVRICVCAFAQV